MLLLILIPIAIFLAVGLWIAHGEDNKFNSYSDYQLIQIVKHSNDNRLKENAFYELHCRNLGLKKQSN